MKIYIARHGETNYNALGLHNADPKVDVYLTEKGIQEAKDLAQKLGDEAFDAIYVSELPRTLQTAEYVNQERNLPIYVDARLNDIDAGFEGKSVADYHMLRDASVDPFTFKMPNAESPEDVYNRVKSFLEYLKHQNYKQVLIVTSKHNFRHFRNIIDGIDPRESLKQHIPNAEVLVREI